MLQRLSIKQLLLLAFLLAGLLPAMIVSLLSFYQTRTVLKQEITHDIETLSHAVSNDIERMIFERMHHLQSWSQLPIMQEIKVGDIDKRLSIFLDRLATSYHAIYQGIYVEDLQGKVVASSLANTIGQHHNKKPIWFNTNNSNPLSFYQLHNNILVISKDIRDDSTQQPIGKLFVEFKWNLVESSLKNAMKQSTAAALLDAQNNLLASTNNWSKIAPLDGMAASSQFSQQAAMPRWQVRIEKLHSDAVAPVHRLGYIFLGLLVSTLLLAAIAVRPIAKAITDPLSQLTAFVKGFAINNKTKPPQSGPPEVRELGQAFENMTADLEKSQANLTRAAKLAVVGEMAATMSHEVRTPLGILRSSAEVLSREQSFSEEGKEVLGFITSETERLNKLVSTLVDAARPRLPVFTTINLTQLISNTIALLQNQANSKSINIIFEPTQAVEVWADADQITQVMMNLIMNAIQVLHEKSQIIIELKQLNKQVIIDVLDNGEGIAKAYQADIFEPFFTKRTGGVGLGLAIVKQIIEAHNGEISYKESHLGGAQFTIMLPNIGRK